MMFPVSTGAQTQAQESEGMLVVGAVFVDVKGFARERYAPRERNVGDVQVTAGGVCRNVVENLCRLGCPARFVSMVDDDAFGAQVRDSLASLGANVDHVIDAPGGMGMWLAILDEKGDLAGSISRPMVRPCLAASALRKFSAPKVMEYWWGPS